MADDVLPAFADVSDALTQAVHALGGWKRMGTELRPEKSAAEAAQWLRDCLNAEKRERLNPDQVVFLLRRAQAAGFHAVKFWLDDELGYERGRPRSAKDEMVELLRAAQALAVEQRHLADRMERLTQSPIGGLAASLAPVTPIGALDRVRVREEPSV